MTSIPNDDINKEEILRLIKNNGAREQLESFIRLNQGEVIFKLRLKIAKFKHSNPEEWRFNEFALGQMEARRKFAKKLPSFINTDSPLIFPSLLSGEQSTNELVAQYHASLIGNLSPTPMSLLDMTAGLGIDFLSIASRLKENFAKCVAIEMDKVKADCLEYNARQLLNGDIEIINGDAIDCVKRMMMENRKFDVIFVDPARRDSKGERLYDPASCSPDVVGNIDLLNKTASNIFIKNSPMIDVKESLRIFKNPKKVYVISVRNECKEVFIHIADETLGTELVTVDIDSNGEIISSSFDSSLLDTKYSGPFLSIDKLRYDIASGKGWLYEPSASLMKIGVWKGLTDKYGLIKLSPNCHIFYSEDYVDGFQGRVTKIEKLLDNKDKKKLKGARLNVVSRNHPEKSAEIEKKYRIVSSADSFLYAVTIRGETDPNEEIPAMLVTRQ